MKKKAKSEQQIDTYYLGMMLYMLLTNGLPSWAKIDTEQYEVHQAEKYELPEFRQLVMSEEVKDLIEQLAKEEIQSADKILKDRWYCKKKKAKSVVPQ